MSIITFSLFLGFAVVVCGFSVFKNNQEKPVSLLAVKTLAILSIVMLALAVCNLTASFTPTAMFVLLALAFCLVKETLAIAKDGDESAKWFENLLNCLTFFSLALSSIFLISISPYFIPVGAVLGIILSTIHILAKKKFSWKKDVSKYLTLVFASILLGQMVGIFFNALPLSNIIFAIAILFVFISAILQTFTDMKYKTSIIIANNIVMYVGLILFAVSIYCTIF